MPEDTDPSDLASFRLDQAMKCLQVAEINMNAGFFKDAANRSYYCIFHSMRAVLAFERFDSKRHSGIISAFRQRYINTGTFPVKYSDIIIDAFEIRVESDYKDFYIVSKDEVSTQIENAREFLTAVKEYITAQQKSG
ncbi:MAG: HEPN domain-containing protein [Chitinispirillales bacterium]|jgi:uncharacterized protein (UPF0332 family)|nr:HEPN domain-containing protein [Chitinispirillales bacterium]